MILCAEFGKLDWIGDRVQTGRVAQKKGHGRIITSSPPDRRQTSENSRQIVGFRVAPVSQRQLANQQSPIRRSARVARRSLETAAFAIAIGIGGTLFCSFSTTVIHL